KRAAADVDGDTDADLLREMEAMRARIAELEARIRARSAQPAETKMSETQPPSVTVSASHSSTVEQAQAKQSDAKPAKGEPFAFADWTWLNGNPRTKEAAFDSKFFTPEIRADVAYHYDFNHPKDDTIGGSSEVFRSNEVSLTHLGIGGDFHYDHV